MGLIFVDTEAKGASVSTGRMTEFGAVTYPDRRSFHGLMPVSPIEEAELFRKFDAWVKGCGKGRPIFVSDNPAFDWQWINDGFHLHVGQNPFGHSARRLGDFYAGLVGDFRETQAWKRLRRTPHDHHPVNDAMGNLEAFERMLNGER